jgi:hypothetical protein
MIKRVLSLDPGGTTGWAAMSYDSSKPIVLGRPTDGDWVVGQLGPHEHHLELRELLYKFPTATIVCESFEFRQYRQRDNINLMSREYIGIVKLFGQERGGLKSTLPVVFQTAGAAKPFVTDEKLKIMGLWVPGQKHARDALRHMVTYLVRKEHRTELVKSWKDLV